MDACITAGELAQALIHPATAQRPLLIDVRRAAAYSSATDMIAGALRRDPLQVDAWGSHLPRAVHVVVYCVHGHQVSQDAAQALAKQGLRAQFLDHGLEGWRETAGRLSTKPGGASTRWVTRERPKIDRIACPWLIRRFIDRDAVVLFVKASEVASVADRFGATPFDIEGVFWSHRGDRCTFDTMIDEFRLETPALKRLAGIVRAADTARHELAPEAAGLLAVSLGCSLMYADDLAQLAAALPLYDALFRWCRDGGGETHTWPAAGHAAVRNGEQV